MADKKNNKKPNASLIEQYKIARPLYEKNTKKFESLIKNLIDESEIKVHSITSRTKDIESFSKNISKNPEKYKNVSDFKDLSGVRICCYFTSQVDEIAELIKKNFVVLPEFSVDKRETIDPDRFGYLSLHYVVKITDERAKLLEYEKYKVLLCEIQIRSILQHAWAEIEHDLVYKSPTDISRNIKRQFSMLAGLLELADKEFDSIRIQAEKELINKRKELKKVSPPSLIKKPAEELKMKFDDYGRILDLYEPLGLLLKPVDYLNRGTDLYYKCKYEEALAAFDKAIELKPDLAEAWYNKGTALSKLGRNEEALAAFDKAIELKPDFAEVWYNKACIYSIKNDKENALKNLSKSIELDPKQKEKARSDEDFKNLWDDEDFKKITS